MKVSSAAFEKPTNEFALSVSYPKILSQEESRPSIRSAKNFIDTQDLNYSPSAGFLDRYASHSARFLLKVE